MSRTTVQSWCRTWVFRQRQNRKFGRSDHRLDSSQPALKLRESSLKRAKQLHRYPTLLRDRWLPNEDPQPKGARSAQKESPKNPENRIRAHGPTGRPAARQVPILGQRPSAVPAGVRWVQAGRYCQNSAKHHRQNRRVVGLGNHWIRQVMIVKQHQIIQPVHRLSQFR